MMDELKLNLNTDIDQTLQSQLQQQLYRSIRKGRLPSGTRLPSSRRLARQLGVARITVINAYDELISHGYIKSRPRSGYFVP